MGRLVVCRYVVEGTLVADTPVHVGAASGDVVSDMPLARDGSDRFHIPGTSLAGPIRRWWMRRDPDYETMFGKIPGRDAGQEEGHASHLTIDDAPVAERPSQAGDGADAAPAFETRDGVGIDRETGSAADGFKYDREVLPEGTGFEFRMEIDLVAERASVVPAAARTRQGPPRPERKRTAELVGALVRALEEGRIRFGGAKTRGLGRLKLNGATVTEQELGRRAGMLARLRNSSPATPSQEWHGVKTAKAAGLDLSHEIAVVVTWRPELPVMNKNGTEGVSVDVLPLVTARGAELVPIVSGASWKGVLRAHSERICRTLAGATPPDPAARAAEEPEARRREFLDDLADSELVEALFGSRGKGKEDDLRYSDLPKDAAIPGLGALSVDDCVIGDPITRGQWDDLLTRSHDDATQMKTGAARAVLDETSWKGFRPSTHVAIDRWTGAAADGLLFSRVETAVGESDIRDLRLWLDFDRIAPRLAGADGAGSGRTDGLLPGDLVRFRRAAFGLLVVVLRELAWGRVPIGYGVTRGLGSVEVERIAFENPCSVAAELGLSDAASDGKRIELTPDDFRNAKVMARFKAVDEAWRDFGPRSAAR